MRMYYNTSETRYFYVITIKIIGLEQFLVGRVSEDITNELAETFEVSEDDISFVASSDMLFHKGIDQTSWNTLIKVHLPESLRDKEKDIAPLLIDGVREYTINVKVFFEYYDDEATYEFVNEEYPRFITSSNSVSVEATDDMDIDEDEEDDGELPSEEELFTGDAFEGFKFPEDN